MTMNDDWSGSRQAGDGLDPVLHPEAWEALVARINTAAAPLLARRRPASILRTLTSWGRPVALGSAGLMAAAAFALLLLPASGASTSEVSLAEVVMPTTVAAWIEGSYEPTVLELVHAVDPYTP